MTIRVLKLQELSCHWISLCSFCINTGIICLGDKVLSTIVWLVNEGRKVLWYCMLNIYYMDGDVLRNM